MPSLTSDAKLGGRQLSGAGYNVGAWFGSPSARSCGRRRSTRRAPCSEACQAL
jgi:hypothetical protein